MRGIIERQRVIGALSRRPSVCCRRLLDHPNIQRGDTVQLNNTNQGGPGNTNVPSGDQEGLLIQFNDGEMTSEAVDVVPGSTPPKDSRRVVINPEALNGLDSITEADAKSSSASPTIAAHGEDGVKRETIETEVAGSIEPENAGEEARLLPEESKSASTSTSTEEGKTSKKDKKKRKGKK